jgi:hypothetical protein
MSTRWLGAVSVVLVACSDPDGSLSGDRCLEPSSKAESVEGALEIGFWGEGEFQPVTQGQRVPFVLGFQGGYMVTPLVRIERARFGSDGHCALMDIDANVAGGPHEMLHYNFAKPRLDGEYWLTDTIPLFLSSSPDPLEGKPCILTATWRDDQLEATSSVEVELYFDESR